MRTHSETASRTLSTLVHDRPQLSTSVHFLCILLFKLLWYCIPSVSNATDLILKFMERDPSKRFGNLQHGAGDVFAHPWFAEVDWERLYNREIPAPYVPKLERDGDSSQ